MLRKQLQRMANSLIENIQNAEDNDLATMYFDMALYLDYFSVKYFKIYLD